MKNECSRCERLGKKRAAKYVFDVDNNRGITVIYMRLCLECYGYHTSVTKDRYKLL